jgi:hypothetical protein
LSFFTAALVNFVFLLDDDVAADLDVARRALAGEQFELELLAYLLALLQVDVSVS